MKLLVTGSNGHLGEGLMRHLEGGPHSVTGLDLNPSDFTHRVGSIADPGFVEEAVAGVDAILHTATLHKPHVATHSRQDFVDTNISGTLNLLESAVKHGVKAFIFTSTTSTFGDAMRPESGGPAVWVNEELPSRPKNIYGVTKVAAENLCHMFHRNFGLPALVLRTSRFFLEDDDNRHKRDAFDNDNLKVNELAFRRADLHDMVTAQLCALDRAPALGTGTFVITATPAFSRNDLPELAKDTPAVLARSFPAFPDIYQEKGWSMFQSIGRVYDNARARQALGWAPEYGFGQALEALQAGRDYRSPLACAVGRKPYHDEVFEDGPFPVEETPDITPGHDL